MPKDLVFRDRLSLCPDQQFEDIEGAGSDLKQPALHIHLTLFQRQCYSTDLHHAALALGYCIDAERAGFAKQY
ncbi:hypothetical protein [Paraburkholderia sp. RL17-373-BIF-A]|uniref:hypothetical protein n=1 Tax=Paraburkholderia sp. RL17-373-BIF-A TaxID=3031629 RepID=UPI0038BBE99A